jgi:hypothetical protein
MGDKHAACHAEKTGGTLKTGASRAIRKDRKGFVETRSCREARPETILWRRRRGNPLRIRWRVLASHLQFLRRDRRPIESRSAGPPVATGGGDGATLRPEPDQGRQPGGGGADFPRVVVSGGARGNDGCGVSRGPEASRTDQAGAQFRRVGTGGATSGSGRSADPGAAGKCPGAPGDSPDGCRATECGGTRWGANRGSGGCRSPRRNPPGAASSDDARGASESGARTGAGSGRPLRHGARLGGFAAGAPVRRAA